MPYDAETLYALLPQYLRLRDAREGGQLRALVGVLAGQAQLFDENLAQLHDDLFIETCADWVAPYIGEMLGVQLLQPTGNAVSPRAEVANTIGYRRRKGTALVLEQLARDVTGWPARAVEFYDRLATTQFLNATRPGNLSFASVRGAGRPSPGGAAFDTTPRTAEVRGIVSRRGRWNLPNVGLFVWRLQPQSSTRVATAPGADAASFFAHPAGVDAPFIRLPEEEGEFTQLAEPRHLPIPITRRSLAEDLQAATPTIYGPDLSLFVEWLDANPAGRPKPNAKPTPIPAKNIKVANLDAWPTLTLGPDDVVIDPETGRLRFGQPPQGKVVLVTCQHGFSANLGGGEYDRSDGLVAEPDQTFNASADLAAKLTGLTGATTLEFSDSGRYAGNLAFTLPKEGRVVLRGANETRATLAPTGEWTVAAPDGGELELDGLLVAGGPLRVTGKATRVRLSHCTLVPGETGPSLVVESSACVVEIASSILGAVRVGPCSRVETVNSIIDAGSPAANAFSAPDGITDGGALSLDRVTVVGRIRAGSLPLVTNSIIHARPDSGELSVTCDRRQTGCLRHSLVPPDARTPRRFNCLPLRQDDPDAFRPVFTSLLYGHPGYAQLSDRTPLTLRFAADDRGEPGVFHDLFQPQREANLRTRLDEYMRFGLQAGILHAS